MDTLDKLSLSAQAMAFEAEGNASIQKQRKSCAFTPAELRKKYGEK